MLSIADKKMEIVSTEIVQVEEVTWVVFKYREDWETNDRQNL